MKFLKIFIRFILRLFSPDLEFRQVNQYHFNKLGRKAPELQWESLTPAPIEVYDAGAAQIGHQLFLFGGSLVGQSVSNKIYILDLEKCTWSEGGKLSAEVPESHSAVVSDQKRFIYFLSGQMGPECRPATKQCFIYDTIKRSWEKMPPMPYARYAPTAQLWGGRLHVLGGSKEDRNTPAHDHCSIAVENGKVLEKSWREEAPIPRGGCDRASIVLEDHLYVLGGQEGDWINDPRVSTYRCTRDFITEIMYPDTYRMKAGSNEWERLADMPVKSSHTEFAVFQLKKKIVLVGGQHDCSNDITRVTDAIQAYDAASNSWKTIGRLPYCTKTISVYYNGWLYFTTGQRDRVTGGSGMAGDYDRSLWRARFDQSLL